VPAATGPRVVDALLDDAEDRGLQRIRQGPRDGGHVEVDAAALLVEDALGERLEGGSEPELVEGRRSQRARHVAQVSEHADDLAVQVVERDGPVVRGVAAEHPQPEQNGGEHLREVLLQLLGHPSPVLLLRIQEVAESGALLQQVIAYPAQLHAERRCLAIALREALILGREAGLQGEQLERDPLLASDARAAEQLDAAQDGAPDRDRHDGSRTFGAPGCGGVRAFESDDRTERTGDPHGGSGGHRRNPLDSEGAAEGEPGVEQRPFPFAGRPHPVAEPAGGRADRDEDERAGRDGAGAELGLSVDGVQDDHADRQGGGGQSAPKPELEGHEGHREHREQPDAERRVVERSCHHEHRGQEHRGRTEHHASPLGPPPDEQTGCLCHGRHDRMPPRAASPSNVTAARCAAVGERSPIASTAREEDDPGEHGAQDEHDHASGIHDGHVAAPPVLDLDVSGRRHGAAAATAVALLPLRGIGPTAGADAEPRGGDRDDGHPVALDGGAVDGRGREAAAEPLDERGQQLVRATAWDRSGLRVRVLGGRHDASPFSLWQRWT
jgi:hypothetical protein